MASSSDARLLCNAGSGRSFTAYVFNKRGFVPPAVRQLAVAAKEACFDALRPPTPCGAREAHLEIVSSQDSAVLDTEDALAWYSFHHLASFTAAAVEALMMCQ